MDLPPKLGVVRVPPFVVQTLAENSVKHAISKSRNGGYILVKARENDGRTLIRVSDDGPGFTPNDIVADHGLYNLRSRLTALFGDEAMLEITRKAGRTTVEVCLPKPAEGESI